MANPQKNFSFLSVKGENRTGMLHADWNQEGSMFAYASTTMKSEFENDIPLIFKYASASKRSLYIVGGCHGKGHHGTCTAVKATPATAGALACTCKAGYPGKTDDSHFSVYKRDITFQGVSFKYVDLSGVASSINTGVPNQTSLGLYDSKILPRLAPYVKACREGNAVLVFSFCYTYWFMCHEYGA